MARAAVLLLVLLAGAVSSVAAAQLPLQWRWLETRLPGAAVQAAVRGVLEGLPTELCRLHPVQLVSLPTKFMDELCPLKASQGGLGSRRLSLSTEINADVAAAPRTLGAAAILLVKPDATSAAALERRLCDIFLDPRAACKWNASWAAAANSTYRTHLDSRAPAEGLLSHLSALQLPSKLPGWFSWRDPLEGPSEGVVQTAMWWFGNAVPRMRSKTLEGYLPQPLHAYVAAAYEALPQQLCRLPHKEIAALPNAFKDQVCPIANTFKPAFGGIGLSTWGMLGAQISMGMNVSARGQFGGSGNAAPAYPDAPAPGDELLSPAAGLPPAAVGNASNDHHLEYKVNVTWLTEQQAAYQAAADADAAVGKRVFSWLARTCHTLYSPETACNASTAAVLNSSMDLWEAYSALKPRASPSEMDLFALRIDARRFASVSALAAALRAMPAERRATLATAMAGPAAGLAARIRAMPPAAALALFGPLSPWMCVPSLEAVREDVHGDLLGALRMLGIAVVRFSLRLDEPSALVGAVLGDSAARPALQAACAAVNDARAAVANATESERAAVGKAAGAVRKVVENVRTAVARVRGKSLPPVPALDVAWEKPQKDPLPAVSG